MGISLYHYNISLYRITFIQELDLNWLWPVVTGWKDNDRHFLETLFETWACPVPRNTSTETASGIKYT